MKYVVDASVVLKWVLPELHSDKALRLRDDFEAAIHELLSPDIFSIEVANTLARAERNAVIAPGEADLLLAVVNSSNPQLHPHHPLLRRALAIATAARHGDYDCVYVALAERERCELVTADDRMIKRLGPTFPFILPLASFP